MKTRFTLFLGGYPLAAALLLVVGLLALRVQAQTTGDFRTSATGANFVVAAKWESYNGTAWVAAGAAPTSSDGMITIRAGHTATVGGAVTLDQLTVRGVLSISSGITLTIADGAGTDLTILDGGTLTQVGTGSIDGAGSFLLEARGNLNIAHANGLAAIGVTGGKTFTAGGYYTFNGTVAQNTGFASATVGDPYTIRIANTHANGVTLDKNLTIANALNINLNAVFAIGAGITSFTAGSIYSRGTVNNCVGATISPAFETSGWASPKGTYNDNTSTEPTTEASALYVCPNKTTAHIYWTNGNGRRRVVVLKAGSAIATNALTDGTSYTASATFGSGAAVDGGSVVYDGVGSQVNVTGLTDGVTYYVAVFEYNGNTLCAVSPNYKLSSPLASSFLAGEKPFITTWQTTAAGESITIPVALSTTYACSVDWGDGSPVGSFSGTSPVISHAYAAAGTYTVKITGTFPRIYFINTGDKTKIQSIEQWGSIAWTSMANAFYGCTNLRHNATDAPNLSGVTDMSAMFRECTSPLFSGAGSMNHWNTAAAISMGQMFYGTTFNQPIASWNTGAMTSAAYMFSETTAFNQPIGSWNTAAVTNMSQMFQNAKAFNQPIGSWNTSATVAMSGLFSGATAFNQPISSWDIAAVTLMNSGVFSGATAFNQPIDSWNTAAVTSMSGMFYQATAFNQPIDSWNTEAVTNIGSMFQSAASFNQPIDSWQLNPNVTMTNMLSSCGMSRANYEATLAGWAAQSVTGRSLGATGLQYCNATDRNTLTATKGWTIAGDISNCDYYRTVGNATFASATNWEGSVDNLAWNTVGVASNSGNGAIEVLAGHTATVTANITLDQLTIQSGGTLQVNTARTLTLNNGTGTDLTVQNGGTLDIQGTGTLAGAGSFTLDAGGTLKTSHENGLNAIGLSGTETFTAGANYVFNGAALQTINNPSGLIANNVTISNASGANLSNNLTINGTLALTSGPLRTGSSKLTLGSGASVLGETGTKYVIGTLESSRTVNNNTVNFGDMGVTINATTSGNNLGAVTVTRKAGVSTLNTSYIQNGGGTKSIDRIWTISPATQPTTGVDVTLSWLTANDNGISDFSAAQIWKSSDGGATWQPVGSTQNASASRSITATFTGFSSITVGGTGASFPVEWLSFEATPTASAVLLDWTTGSEQNNAAFSVERSEDGRIFAEIGTVAAVGNSTTPTAYSYTDAALPAGAQTLHYRLRQTDMDGVSTLSETRTVQRQRHTGVSVAPNPTTGMVQVIGLSGQVAEIQVFTAAGQRLYTVPTDGKAALGIDLSAQPAGVYLLRAGAATFRVVRQ